MEIKVALRYPNGRVHETVVESAQPLPAGSEFAMYGRIWRVIGQQRNDAHTFPQDRLRACSVSRLPQRVTPLSGLKPRLRRGARNNVVARGAPGA